MSLGIYLVFVITKDKLRIFNIRNHTNLLLLSIILAAFWVIFYYYYHTDPWTHKKLDLSQNVNHLPAHELMKMFLTGRGLVTYSEISLPYVGIIFLCLLAFLFVSLYIRIQKLVEQYHNKQLRLLHSDVWLIGLILITIAYFIYPDSNGRDSIISVRFLIAFYFFSVVYILNFNINKYFQVIVMTVVSITSIFLWRENLDMVRVRNKTIVEPIIKYSKTIKNKAVILPIIAGKDWGWLDYHIHQYFGVYKDVLVLDVFPSITGYYPILLKINELPKLAITDSLELKGDCNKVVWKTPTSNKIIYIDYIFTYSDLSKIPADFCSSTMEDIKRYYVKEKDFGPYSLYKKR